MESLNKWELVKSTFEVENSSIFCSYNDETVFILKKGAQGDFEVFKTGDFISSTELYSSKKGPKYRLTPVTALSADSLFLIGGSFCFDSQVVYLRDAWIFKDKDFTQLSTETVPEIGCHTCTAVDHKILLFGGKTKGKIYDSLYEIDTQANKCVELDSLSAKPSPRFGHTATKINNSVFVYGGYDGSRTLSDLYELSLRTMIWYTVTTEGQFAPPSVYRHTAAAFDEGLLIFGGIDSTSNRKERALFAYSSVNKKLELKICSEVSPPGLTFHYLVPLKGWIYVVGGLSEESTFNKEIRRVKVKVNHVLKKPCLKTERRLELSENVPELQEQVTELLLKYEEEAAKNLCKYSFKQNLLYKPNKHCFLEMWAPSGLL